MQLSFTEKKNIRKNFGKLKEGLSIPNLIEVQKNSYKELTELKDNIDKKQMEICAERYVEVCADFGADDEAFKGALGSCNYLDNAIYYYLDLDEDPYEEEYEWDE